MLSATLGPGLLGQVFDGLLNPLQVIAGKYGYFLPRGVDIFPLNRDKKWNFIPTAKVGDKLAPGQAFGTVQEGHILHKIMIPFGEPEKVELTWIHQGPATIETPVAKIRRVDGTESSLPLFQRWPVLLEGLFAARPWIMSGDCFLRITLMIPSAAVRLMKSTTRWRRVTRKLFRLRGGLYQRAAKQ